MFIDQSYRKCIAFLLWENHLEDDSTDGRLFGTAFFLSIQCPYDPGTLDAPYLVTAKHGIEKLKTKAVENTIIRLNRKESGFDDFILPISDWKLHPFLDIAVCFIHDRSSLGTIEWKHLSAEHETVSEEFRKDERVTEGSDIFMIGLFSNMPGVSSMQPIVRFGNISLMDYEPLPLPTSEEPHKVFLCETRSWAGYSGSPVFAVAYSGKESRLLGMISGHYLTKDSLGSEEGPLIHAGISYVTRIEDIIEFLNQEEFRKVRKEFWDNNISIRNRISTISLISSDVQEPN